MTRIRSAPCIARYRLYVHTNLPRLHDTHDSHAIQHRPSRGLGAARTLVRSDSGGVHYGDEIDVMISKKFGKHWTALAKYAYFDGKETPTAFDVDKIWAQVEFNY